MNASARRMLSSGLMLWLLLAGFCLYYIFPIKKNVKFGIDLVGGSYLTLEVQTEKAVETELLGLLQKFSKKISASGKILPSSKIVKDQKIIFTFDSPAGAQETAVLLKGERDMVVSMDGSQVLVGFTEKKEQKIKSNAVATNIEVFRTRLDKMAIAEIAIASEGERNIVIELPGVADSMQARAMIGNPAILELKLVEFSASSPENIEYEYDGQIPDDMEIVPGRPNSDGSREYHLVPRYTDLTGKDLVSATSGVGGSMGSQFVVHFKFSSEGGNKFYDLTSRNVGKYVAAILDGEAITVAKIKVAIRDEGYIEGGFTSERAKDVAMLLRSGALVAPVTIEGEQQIGPTLGQDSIGKGLISCLVGLVLLLIFGVIYYSLCGLYTFIALLFNLILVLFGMSMLGGVLTLPGIAGLVLTVGMAIDASILIYEKVKEGLASGLSIKKAIDTGFAGAMAVILDANITTFIVGLVLYKFGTGPLQGFAVTMMLGIISTLITGLFFLKSIFNFILDNFRVQKLKI